MIPFNNFVKKYFSNKHGIDQAIARVFKKGEFILGHELSDFEKNFARYLKVKYVVGLNSGTDAIFLALKALDVNNKNEVITVSHTATPTISAIRMTGAIPVFIDVKESDYTINPDLIVKKINKKTKAILPVHIYGMPADMHSILEIAKKYKLAVVEDAAQATGGKFENNFLGTIGDVGCFSFYPTKNLGAFGDAGAIATNNKRIASLVRSYRNYGEVSKFNNKYEGVNSRLDELQAAILNLELNNLDSENKKRDILANIYFKELKSLPIVLPKITNNQAKPSWHLFVVRVKNRDKMKQYLEKKGIQTMIHYPKPVHRQKAYLFLKNHTDNLPITEKVSKEILSLPLYPELSKRELLFICNMIKSFFC